MKKFDAAAVRRIGRATEMLKGKWTVLILCAMLDGPVRLSQLRRTIPGASKKALTANLRWLEKAHIILRQDLSNATLHVEYKLVDAARATVLALVNQLAEFHRLQGTARLEVGIRRRNQPSENSAD
jgi:DNA-binding HxlR family transcriptional regulator